LHGRFRVAPRQTIATLLQVRVFDPYTAKLYPMITRVGGSERAVDDRDLLRMIGRERDALHLAQCQQRAAETRHHNAKIAEILKLILAERQLAAAGAG
jgi:hypothetical protein